MGVLCAGVEVRTLSLSEFSPGLTMYSSLSSILLLVASVLLPSLLCDSQWWGGPRTFRRPTRQHQSPFLRSHSSQYGSPRIQTQEASARFTRHLTSPRQKTSFQKLISGSRTNSAIKLAKPTTTTTTSAPSSRPTTTSTVAPSPPPPASPQSDAWVLPPSLMAVAAVPDGPVIQLRSDEPTPATQGQAFSEENREIFGESDESEDLYLRFMAVPAVPDTVSAVQQLRKPKDSLNSLPLRLNVQNSIGQDSPAQQPPVQKAPVQRTPVPSAPAQQPPVQQAPVPSTPAQQAPVIKEPVTSGLSAEEEKKEKRKKFKRCQGRCVQKFCLPVGNLTVYEECVNKCKDFCT